MVTITGIAAAKNSASGEEFILLILSGSIELIQSQTTGRFYATARKASIPSTFTKEQAELMIGKELPGTIKKLKCEAYDYVIEDSGEVIQLEHRWEYVPEETSLVKQKEVIPQPMLFSTNGQHELAQA